MNDVAAAISLAYRYEADVKFSADDPKPHVRDDMLDVAVGLGHDEMGGDE